MKYEILDMPSNEYKKSITIRVIICIAVAAAAVILNILLTVFGNDATHIAFLVINIVADAVAFCFMFFFVSTQILYRKKLYRLSNKRNAEISGVIKEVSKGTQTVNGLECYELTVESNSLRKVFLVKEGGIPATISGQVRLNLADNIIIAAEVPA